jgi:flavin reductase (DIM6/NTAB) family NADH-FMN oxidoreductase RutF
VATKRLLEPTEATRLLEPGPVTLVTSRFRSADNVMTAGWLMPVSLDPPRIAIAVHPGRLSHEYITKSEFFALNIPTAELLNAVHHCGMVSGRDGDKFAAAGLTPVDALELELPLVGECVAHIECGLVARAAFGDHDLFIGEPLVVTALDEAFNERWLVELDPAHILHHLRADHYATLSRPYQAAGIERDE